MSPVPLTIALTKGRILQEILPLLAAANIHPEEDMEKSRKLIFATNQPNVRLLVLRGSDVTTYVRYGTADLGVAGKDMLMEYGSESAEQCGDQGIYELLDLGIARCKLMTAGKADQNPIRPSYQSGYQICQCGQSLLCRERHTGGYD